MTAFGVLFDMDGVLVDSASLHIRAYEQVFQQYGLVFSEGAKSAVRGGKSRSEVLRLALRGAERRLEEQLAAAKPKALAALLESQEACSAPGAVESVRTLRHAGIPMAVVTNSRTPELWLEKLGIQHDLSAVVTGADVRLPKPSPEGYLLGAKRLGLLPGRCLAVEDSRDGWMAARSAGMQVVVIASEKPVWLDDGSKVMPRLDPTQIVGLLEAQFGSSPVGE